MAAVVDSTPNPSEDADSLSHSVGAAMADTASDGKGKRPASQAPVNATQLRDRTRKKRHTIKKLEKKLEVLHRQIKKFNEAEVTLEEMESGTSAYMKEDLLKRKFVATWYELCEFVGISPDIEIVHEESSAGYSKTPYPEINRRVTRLLRRNEFPDHYDIVELIERCNTKHELGISAEEKAQLSREVFKDVGKLMKAQRAKDFRAHFGSHLTDEALKKNEDPATSDAALLDSLKKSLKEGQEKLEELCEGFVVKQELEGEQEKSHDSEQSESDDEDEEEEEQQEGEGEEEAGEEEGEGENEEGEGEGEGVEAALGEDVEPSTSGVDLEDDIDDETLSSKSSGNEDESDGSLPPIDLSTVPPPPPSEQGGASAPLRGTKRELTDRKKDSSPQAKKVRLDLPVANHDKDRSAKVSSTGKSSNPSSSSSLPTHTTVIVLDDDDDGSDSDIILLSD